MHNRSLFHRSLDVLTFIYNEDSELYAICDNVKLGPDYVEELLGMLYDWELIEDIPDKLQITERGRNVLSFYHNYSGDLRIVPMVQTKIPDD